jgi:hypothetical protein
MESKIVNPSLLAINNILRKNTFEIVINMIAASGRAVP